MEQPEDRIWASQWYRVTPRSFVHEELFFDPTVILRIFAGESYKSLLLRRDGRETYAQELGEEYRQVPAATLRADDDVTAIEAAEMTELHLQSGSWLRKPKLTLETTDSKYTYYHYSRRHEVSDLGDELAAQYPTVPVRVDGDLRD